MPASITCPRCGETYTVEEYERDEFCRKCESHLRIDFISRKREEVKGWRRLFPYQPYEPQIEFMKDIEETVAKGNVLIAEACNGFGKTISSLSCLLPTGKQIIYATRTHEQVRQVLLELQKINEKSGESYTAVNLASRGHLCINPDCRDLPPNEALEMCHSLRKDDECPYTSEIDRVPGGIAPILDKGELIRQGRRLNLCPYFLARNMAKHSKIIVAPYPYIFDHMIRMMIGLDLEGKILVLDEGHNIDQVGQDILSDTLSERVLSAAAEELKLIGKSPRFINRIGEHLLRTDTGKSRLISQEQLERDLELALGMSISKFMDNHAPLVDPIRTFKSKAGNPPVSSLNGLLEFLELLQTSQKEKYVAMYTRNYYSAPVIEYRCLDPSLAIEPVVEEANGVLIMSGTLSPIDIFSEIIGQEDALQRAYPNIQKSDKIKMMVETGVTSSYRERTDDMITHMGEIIAGDLTEVRQGALIFFTQRGFMNQCLDSWSRKGILRSSGGRMYMSGKQLFREGSNAHQNRDIVDRYKRMAVSIGGAVLCCVFRGRNSEGSNFPDDQARAIFLVGVPYANYGDPLVKAQIKYFNRIRRGLGNKWYTMDAFRAANQSLGRGIRGSDDWCHYWLLDRRYSENLGLISKWAQGQNPKIRHTSRAAQQRF
jgi:Rad3-related DNA helicase